MDITADILAAFRAYYPEFSDDEQWPDALLSRVLCEGDEETGGRWGNYDDPCSLKKRGLFAYAAHKAVLAKAAARAVEAGGIAPAPAQVASKSVGDESVSYAVSAPSAEEAIRLGDFSSTLYGLEFLRLRRRAGMGAVAV